MAYCTQADVANAVRGDKRLVQLADWTDSGVADASVIANKIAEASDWVDSYARAHHSVPFEDAEVPEIIRRKVAREVIYLLCLDGGMVPPHVETQHGETLEWLTDLARGRVRIALKSEQPKKAAGAETGELKSSTGSFDSPDFGGLW